VEITYANRKLEKELTSEKEMSRQLGHVATKLKLRLFTLRAVSNLDLVPKHPPDRCHELIGSRKGTFTVDLSPNWRLVFKPDPMVQRPDGGIDLAAVTRVQILSIEDTH
jgi:plasmid maintenance system killer protein